MLVTADQGLLVVDGDRVAAPARRRWLAAAQPYLYVLPAVVGVAVWIYLPIAQTARLSLYEWNLLPTTPQVPVGLDNYRDVVELPQMRTALWNTAKYTLGLLPFSVVIPLGIALLLADLGGRMRSVYRVFVFLPVLMAPVVVGVVWRWMLHPTNGIVNRGLELVGISGPNWFRDEHLALWTITGITGWKLIGFSTLIFAAGIAGLDQDAHDAARIDGATRWQVVRRVTLPLLSPTVLFMVLLTVLLSAQWTFPLINVLTDGGPLNSTTNVYHLLWKFGFRNFDVGFSSAAAVLFFAAFGALALGCVRLLDRFSFYDS